jgi:hypothetical protein
MFGSIPNIIDNKKSQVSHVSLCYIIIDDKNFKLVMPDFIPTDIIHDENLKLAMSDAISTNINITFYALNRR